jgi:hypothetical protein
MKNMMLFQLLIVISQLFLCFSYHIEKVKLGNNPSKVVHDEFLQQSKYSVFKQLSTEKLSYYHSSKSCDVNNTAKFADKFLSLGADNGGCPREDWIEAMAGSDPFSSKVFINIGVNKGYNFAIWLNNFLPFLQITANAWYKSLLKFVQSKKHWQTCGVCSDCGTEFHHISSKLNDSASFVKANSHIHMLGVDLNCQNFPVIHNILGSLPTLQNQDFASFYTLCAGLSDKPTSKGNISPCQLGEEVCHLGRKLSAEIPLTTVDELVHEFLFQHFNNSQLPPAQHHHHQSPDSQLETHHSLTGPYNFNLSTHPHFEHDPFRHYFHISSTKPYQPLVDILMIDTEGYDYLVIQGARQLLQSRNVRILIFEYHQSGVWRNYLLEDLKNQLLSYGYDCYYQGQGRLWKISGKGCWSERYEFHNWSNVMCVRREDIWYEVIQSMVVTNFPYENVDNLKNTNGR